MARLLLSPNRVSLNMWWKRNLPRAWLSSEPFSDEGTEHAFLLLVPACLPATPFIALLRTNRAPARDFACSSFFLRSLLLFPLATADVLLCVRRTFIYPFRFVVFFALFYVSPFGFHFFQPPPPESARSIASRRSPPPTGASS